MQAVHESLDRHHIELLVRLHETGHLRHAAEALHLSPSAASHRLKEAERRLGVALAVPHGRSIRLTDAARHLAEVGAATQQSLRSAEETARWMSSADRPAVRIALDFYDTAPWFEQLIGSPRLPCDVDFIRIGYGEVRAAVVSRRADLGVVVEPIADSSVDDATDHPRRDELVAVVREDHQAVSSGTLSPEDVSDSTYLTAGDRPSHGFEHYEFFEPAGVRPRRLRKVESLAMILRLISNFGGITVQPARAVAAAQLDGLAVLPLAGRQIGVAWSTFLRPDASENEQEMAAIIDALIGQEVSESTLDGANTRPAWADL